MNPLILKETIENSLRNDIREKLPVFKKDEDIGKAIEDAAKKYNFVQEPYVEPQPLYKHGHSLNVLITEGLIHEATAKLFALSCGCSNDATELKKFFLKFKLYEHQERALENVRKGKNLIVCSGTGSGKTECFLLPLLDYLVREKIENQQMNKGVRALLLYPMNALVNDQLRRLRSILKHCQSIDELRDKPITFGRFTGETPSIDKEINFELTEEQKKTAEGLIKDEVRCCTSINDDMPVGNEITKRSDWCSGNVGDILVTNYSMLERLLLRPDTSAIFKTGKFWRFIVLDEAHSYDGSQGTEIAWLIRRLSQRIRTNTKDKLQYLATSATLIDGDIDEIKLALSRCKLKSELYENKLDINELKTIYIKNEFASKIFPAHPESFHIEFGIQIFEFNKIMNYKGRSIENILDEYPSDNVLQIINDNAFLSSSYNSENKYSNFLIWFNEVKSFWNKCDKTFNCLLKDCDVISAGDLLELLKLCVYISPIMHQVNPECYPLLDKDKAIAGQIVENFDKSIVKNTKFFSWCYDIVRDFLDFDNENNDRLINALHDDLDVRNNYQRTTERGNKKEFLKKEWDELINENSEEPLANLSVTGLEYLLSIVHEAVLGINEAYSPYRMFLSLHESFIDKIKEWKQCVNGVCDSIIKLELGIKQQLGDFTKTENPLNTTIEKILGCAILANDNYHKLRKHVVECHQRRGGKTPADSIFCKIAESLFPRDNDYNELLDKWNTISSFGQSEDGRPLWDIRYHQMVRGISGAIIRFCIEEKQNPNDELDKNIILVKPEVNFEEYSSINDEKSNAVEGKSRWFLLGICYRCYQPYLIGYSDVNVINENGVLLHTIESDRYCYKHIFAPCNSDDLFDSFSEDKASNKINNLQFVYLEPYEGKLYSSDSNNNRIKCRYYQNPDSTQTPCCESKPVKDMLVSIYKYMGDLSKITVMMAILEQTPPSSNPVSRSYFGEGKKLIAFSDTRFQAARLAVEFDKSIRDKNISYLLYHAIRDERFELMEEDYENADFDEDDINHYANKMKNNVNLCRIGLSLRNQIKENKLEEQFLWLDYEDGSKMSSWDASILQLIRALRQDKMLLDKICGKLAYSYSEDIIIDLRNRADNFKLKFDEDKAIEAFEEVLSYLVRHTALSRKIADQKKYEAPGSYSYLSRNRQYSHDFLYGVHPEWYYLICNKKNDKDIVLGDKDKRRLVNRIMLSAFKVNKDNINLCHKIISQWYHDKVWKFFIEGHPNANLIDKEHYFFKPQFLNITPLENHNSPDKPFASRIEEHTAQIDSSLGRAYQNAFAEGKINVLSCSTTFEMGVDLGDLSSVFLSNQPPLVANYKQRAGRAGRRAGMAANVITYIGDDAHDRYYFEHPDEMFFGKVTPPVIYLDNPVFRARHLRAEAMHDFLVWAMDKTELKEWEKVGYFFFGLNSAMNGGTASCWLNSLTEWANCKDTQNNFDKWIDDIIGEKGKLDYNVKDDLLWQLIGCNRFGDNDGHLDLYHRLAGPNMGNNMDYDLYSRMVEKLANVWPDNNNKNVLSCRTIYKLNDLHQSFRMVREIKDKRVLKRFLLENTIDYLTRSRVLPLYGFPSDVIELLKDKDDSAKVELTRDMKQGLYEYAPGKEVLANKRVFVSEKPIFYAVPRSRKEQHGVLQDNAMPHYYKWCIECYKILRADENCNNAHHLINAYRPDAFKAQKSKSAQSFTYNKPERRIFDIPGPAADYYNTKYNFSVSENQRKEVVYLNTNGNNGFIMKFGYNDMKYCLIHIVHTDVLHIQLKARSLPDMFKNNDNTRKENAWKSVAAGLQLAIQDILNVSKRDVSIKSDFNSLSWAIFDASSGGAGFMYKLLLSKNSVEELGEQEVEHRVSLIRAIIEKAKLIVEGGRGCSCYKDLSEDEKNKIPSSYGNVLTDPETYRSYRSCYHCLRSYENKNDHDILDVYDAAVILKAMLVEDES